MTKTIQLPTGMLQANSPIHISGLGTVFSPLLKDIYATENNMINLMIVRIIATGDKKEILDFLKTTSSNLNISNISTKFQAVTCSENLVVSFLQGLNLFVKEKCIYDKNVKCFYFLDSDDKKVIGIFDENTFDVLCDILRQLLHVRKTKSLKKQEEDISPELKKIMSEFAKYENIFEASSDNKNYTLENIISKLGVNSNSYTLINIYDLTLWQLYNQFEAYRLGRQAHVVDRSYSIWGGEKYEDDLWLENIE